jgi:hypothetical protein
VYGEENFCLYNTVDPSDIKQGYAGDCYFLSSLASLAEFPDRIKKIFKIHEVNKAGCYAVQFFVNGEERVVVVDDQFPYCSNKSNWAFSRPSNSQELKDNGIEKLEKVEIWVLVLEKAWAKVYGSY